MDARLTQYKHAIASLKNFKFDIEIPIKTLDAIGEVGASLLELADALREKFIREEKMASIIEKVNAGFFLDDVMSHIYSSFCSVIPYNRIGCALLEEDGQLLRACWASSDSDSDKIQLRNGFSAKMAGSSLQQILDTGRPRIINDLETYFDDHPRSESTKLIVEEGMRSSLTCPLIALGNPIGFLFFSSWEKDTYRNLHQEIFLRLAGQVSVVVEKSRLYQKVVNLNRELTNAQQVLKEQATHDPLTGLWNRGAILGILNKHLALAKRERKALAVFLADIDSFKRINDSFGHQTGDLVIQRVASKLASAVRSSDVVGRYGGEEFIVVAYPCDAEGARVLGEHLCETIRRHPLIVPEMTDPLYITISAGFFAVERGADVHADQLIKKADEALYVSKRLGKDRVTAGC